ncbi:hypothetical protein [Nocardia sp. CA-120079]|uniref:hypothetical protein n=1 Tax=Nocardia sp. CA-120079 TaxID=3239974 RepID=UPI003D952FA8
MNERTEFLDDPIVWTLVERTRAFLQQADLPLDRAGLNVGAESLQGFLRDNRVAKLALMRWTEELGSHRYAHAPHCLRLRAHQRFPRTARDISGQAAHGIHQLRRRLDLCDQADAQCLAASMHRPDRVG